MAANMNVATLWSIFLNLNAAWQFVGNCMELDEFPTITVVLNSLFKLCFSAIKFPAVYVFLQVISRVGLVLPVTVKVREPFRLVAQESDRPPNKISVSHKFTGRATALKFPNRSKEEKCDSERTSIFNCLLLSSSCVEFWKGVGEDLQINCKIIN